MFIAHFSERVVHVDQTVKSITSNYRASHSRTQYSTSLRKYADMHKNPVYAIFYLTHFIHVNFTR